MRDSDGVAHAGLAALLGLVFAVGCPSLLQDVVVPWQQITLLSIALGSVVLVSAAFILALVAQIVEEHTARSSRVLLVLSEAFLIAAVGAFVVLAIFAFVLRLLVLA